MHKLIVFYLFLSILSISKSSNSLTLPFTPAAGLNFYGSINTFGQSVARAGDINGDGIDDVIIGSPKESSDAGIVYVIYGSKTRLTDLASTQLATLYADGRGFQITGFASGKVGFSVNCAGDVNGDGIEDIIIGAPSTGYAYVMFGKKTGLRDLNLPTDSGDSSIGFKITGPGGLFGASVSGTGDVNGDGVDDIIIGAPYFGSGSYIGSAYVIYGKKTGLVSMTLTTTTDLVSSNTGFTILGSTSSEVGHSVSGAGDVNGDGIADTLVGGYYYNLGYGFAAVLFGSKSTLTDITLVPGTSLSGRGYLITSAAVMYLGSSVSSAGDINGDGLADIIVGGYYADLVSPTITDGGAVWVIYGSKTWSSEMNLDPALTISSSRGFKITSGISNYFLGAFTSNAGDFNGDGVDDIILGASGSTGSTNGAVYVIYGSKTGLSNIDRITPITFTDPNKGFVIRPIYSAYSVGWGGDFNGDGGPDILIGAQTTSTALGGMYMLFGAPPPVKESSEMTSLNAMISVLTAATKATDAAVVCISIINFSNPFASILKSISDTIYFIKYLNITYPPKVQYVIDNAQSEDLITLDNLSSAPQALVDDMTKYPLPAMLEKYDDNDGFHSSFFINFWPSLITLSVVLIFVSITSIFKACSSSSGGGKSGKIKRFFRWICAHLSKAVKWNLMLSKFSDCYGDISLFTFIEIRTTRVSSFLEVLSLCICIIVTLGFLLAQIRMILVVHKLQKAKALAKQQNNIKKLEATEKQLKDYGIIFENFKDGSFLQQSFFFLYSLRIYLFYAVIFWLDAPVIQTLLNTLMGVIMMLYLAISRPLKSKIELFQYIVIELIFLVVNICTLALALLDFYESDNQKTRIGLGDALLFCNNALVYSTLSFLLLSLLFIFADFVKLIKQTKLDMKKRQKGRNRLKYRNNLNNINGNQNDSDVSIVELNLKNSSPLTNANRDSRSKIVRTESKMSILNLDSSVQSHSTISLANQLDNQTYEFPTQENFRIKQRRIVRRERTNLNGLRTDDNT